MSWNCQAPDIVSVCYVMKWSIPRYSVNLLCHEMVRLDHFMTKQTDTMSGAWPFHDITDSHYVWGLTISWHNRMILCLSLDLFMTKQTDTMSGAWPFHDKTDWYYVWGLTISWQNRLILCLRLDHYMTKQTDTISGASSFHGSSPRHSICLLCHEMVNPQT
jgi:hypothetical protein